MVNRILIRIKVVQLLYSFLLTRNSNEADAERVSALKALERSLSQAHKLYVSIFVLIVRLTEERARQLENAKAKFLATEEDKNPNTRFIDNELAEKLSVNKEIESYIKKYGIDWTDDTDLLHALLDSIMKSSYYQEYMEAETTDWKKDCEFWRQILKNVVFQSDDLLEALEADSVFWNDDLHIIGTFVLKTIRVMSQGRGEGEEIKLLPQYKDEEDSRFGAELFELAVDHKDSYSAYIEKFVDKAHWDSERIALMDMVIMICAIAEIINYPNIPLAVSLNEYIDIANLYSSAKSGQFINGLLYNVVQCLNREGLINK